MEGWRRHVKMKHPRLRKQRGVFLGEPGGDLLSQEVNSLSSAQLRFTVLFEMGRGGSEALWPPSITCCFVAGKDPGREAKTGKKVKNIVIATLS